MSGLTFLLELVVKSTLVLLVAGSVCWILRNRTAALRHAVSASAMVVLLILPLIQVSDFGFPLPDLSRYAFSLTVPDGDSRTVEEIDATAVPRPTLDSTSSDGQRMQSPVPSQRPALRPHQDRARYLAVPVFGVAWLLGLLVIVSRLARQILAVGQMITRGEPVRDSAWQGQIEECAEILGLRSSPMLLLSRDCLLPITWGAGTGTVVLPVDAKSWSPSRRRAVLLHELAHLRRHDWATSWMAELTRALYWPHPLAWHALARLRSEAERACDDLVLEGGVENTSYARDLVELTARVRHTGFACGLSFACRNSLGSRVDAILDETMPRYGLRIRGLATVLLLAMVVSVGIGCPRFGPAGPRASEVQSLVSLLAHPDPQQRQRAAWALGELEDRRAVGDLVSTLSDPDAGVRAVGAWALGEIKDRSAVAPLLDTLHDSDPLVREAVVRALGEIEDSRAVHPLAELVRNPRASTAVRSAAVWALGEIATSESRAVVRNALTDQSAAVRIAAVEAVDGRGAEALIDLADDGESRVRFAVARRLGLSGVRSATGSLLVLLADSSPEIRAEAATALGRIGDASAVGDLIGRMRDPDPDVRSAATWALDEIGS